MNRYRSYGERDDQPQVVGDGAFKGVDEYNAVENIAEGEVQQAVNMDFTSQDAVTRGGFVCLPATSRLGNPIGFINSNSSTLVSPNLVYGNGVYVGVALFTSGGEPIPIKTFVTTDLVNRTFGTNSWSPFQQYNSITPFIHFKSGVFYLFVSDSLNFDISTLYTSTDGLNWTTLSTLPTDAVVTYCWSSYDKLIISYEIKTGVISQDYRTAISSDNGNTWVSSNTISLGLISSIVYYNGVFIGNSYLAFGNSSATSSVAYSYDGLNWYQSQLPSINGSILFPSPALPLASINTGGGDFLLCFFNTDIYKSYDGINWEKTFSLPIPKYPGVGYGSVNTNFPVVYYQGMYLISLGTAYYSQISPAPTRYTSIYSTIDGYNLVLRYRITNLSYGNTSFFLLNNVLWYRASATPTTRSIVLSSASAFASTVYTDPNVPADQWIAVVGPDAVGFYASGRSTRTVSLNGQYVTEQSTIVQCNNLVYIFRGANSTPLYWNGDWSSTFQLAPTPTPPSGFQIIPNSNQATYYQNRLWIKKGKDEILASDILDFNTYETITNSFNLNTGSSDYIVATFPFGDKTLLVFKNKSVLALNNVEGSLADVTATEVTRQVGLVGIRAITSVGPDLAYVSYKNVNLITLTATNNSVQHKTLPLSFKIKKIMDRVNWEYAYKISLGYADNKLYVALPLDNSTFCNAVAVYNFVTGQWYGEWNFDGAMNMCIQDFQVANYLGLQKIHAVTEDGRIFVIGEGNTDISNQVYEPEQTGYVPSSYDISTTLVTRAYDTSGLNHYQRRMYMDLATLRPSFSVVAYTEGASENSTLITDQTYSRSESWKFNDTPYDLTNANNDYNRAYRKDYSTGATSIQAQSGFEPEMLQEFRLPLMTTRQGRLSWLEITNTQGTINIMSAGFETRPGQRSNLVQV